MHNLLETLLPGNSFHQQRIDFLHQPPGLSIFLARRRHASLFRPPMHLPESCKGWSADFILSHSGPADKPQETRKKESGVKRRNAESRTPTLLQMYQAW
jgi:hypothetical protein